MKDRNGEQEPAVVSERTKQAGEAYHAERSIWTDKMLAALEGVKGNKWFSLIDKVNKMGTLELAWAKVQLNAGACGVDGITIERFGKDSQKRLIAVNEQIRQGSYQPKPVKRVWIPKAGSKEQRPLGIPTVGDRVVQTALRMVIEPIFEQEFAPSSYGFRPGRGSKDALRRVDELLSNGYVHVVDVDIRGYFDNISHEKLMERVEERVADGRVLELIRAFLKQGVMEQVANEPQDRTSGTPQGGVISPLLANIYLNPLDWLLSQAGIEAVRYADDVVMLCKDPAKADRALKLVSYWMNEAGLELHPEKTRIVDMGVPGEHFDFLGYRFWHGKTSRKVKRFVRPKSAQKFRSRIKPLTKRANGHSIKAIAFRLNPIIRGFYEYFKHVSPTVLKGYDGWIRGRLRSIMRKRCKLRGRARGIDHQRWNNHYFAKLGLICMEDRRALEIANLRNGVKC